MSQDRGNSAVPDGGWGWIVVFGSTLIHFLVVGMGRSFGVFYLDMLDRFQGSAQATAWVVAIYNTFRMAFGPVAGILCDHFTTQRVAMVAGVVISAGCIISAFATSLTYCYFSFGIVAGLGGSFLFTPSYVIIGFLNTYWAFFGMTIAYGLVEGGFHGQRATIVSEFVAKDQMSSTVGFVMFFQGLGVIAGPPVAGMIFDMYQTYNYCYFFGGAALGISSAFFLAEYFIRKMVNKRQEAKRQTSNVAA